MNFQSLLNSMVSGGTRGNTFQNASQGRGSGNNPASGLLGSLFGGGESQQQPTGSFSGQQASGGGILGRMASGMVGRAIGGGVAAGGLSLIGGLASSLFGGRDDNDDDANRQGNVPGGGFRGPGNAAAFNAGLSSHDAEQRARVMVVAMLNAAKADGNVTQDEIQRIMSKLREFGAGQDELQFADQELQRPLDLDGLVAQVTDRQMAAEVYTVSCLAIDLDSPQEQAYLDALRQRLGLDQPPAYAGGYQQAAQRKQAAGGKQGQPTPHAQHYDQPRYKGDPGQGGHATKGGGSHQSDWGNRTKGGGNTGGKGGY